MAKKKRKSQSQVAKQAISDAVIDTQARNEKLLGSSLSGRVGLAGAQYSPQVEIDTDKPLVKLPTSTLSDRLPSSVARKIIGAAQNLKHDPNKVPALTDDEVAEIIGNNPEKSLEGLTRLGRVLPVPNTVVEDAAFDAMEVKARVVADLRKGHIAVPKRLADVDLSDLSAGLHISDATTIDVTAVFDRWMAQAKGNDLYELHMAPPWLNALLVYNNPIGNVWAMHLVGSDLRRDDWTQEGMDEIQWQPQPPADHLIDWDRVRWIFSVQVYAGGRSSNGHWSQVVGPLMIWRVAVYEDGSPADVHWTHLAPEVEMHMFNNALGVLTETLNMCNCVNVHVAYPQRKMHRAQRRRMDRLDVRFSEIHIKPASKSYKGVGDALADMEVPLHGVRGHYAEFGVNGKGLLFGRLSGRFWIPPHIRGTAAVGEVAQSYVTE